MKKFLPIIIITAFYAMHGVFICNYAEHSDALQKMCYVKSEVNLRNIMRL